MSFSLSNIGEKAVSYFTSEKLRKLIEISGQKNQKKLTSFLVSQPYAGTTIKSAHTVADSAAEVGALALLVDCGQ